MEDNDFTTDQIEEMKAMDVVTNYLGDDTYVVFDEKHKPEGLPKEVEEAFDYVVRRQEECIKARIKE